MNRSSPRRLARRFELVRRLGAGGMAIVYDAIDQVTGARVALKVLSSVDSGSRARFKREFRVMQDVHHPNLVRLHELYEDDDQLFFTMDLIDGLDFLAFVRGQTQPLDADNTLPTGRPDALSRVKRGGTRAGTRLPCDELRLRDALAQLVRAVTAVHDRALVHRDIKPSNILITHDGELRLLDFGLISDPALYVSTVQQLVGTAGYMAPEQAGDGPVGPQADWYSVGAMLFEALTGTLPYSGAPVSVIVHKQLYDAPAPSALVFDVPPDLDRLCARLLTRDPARRPGGREIAAALGVDVHAPAQPTLRAATPRTASGVFVGRRDERRWLRAQYDRTRTDGSVVASIEGESGIGKTALVHQFIDDLRGDDPSVVVLRGRCYERESVLYKGIDGVVDSLQAFLCRLSQAEAAALTPRHAGALLLQFPALASVPALATSAQAVRLRDPRAARTLAMDALRELLLRMTDRYRLVIWLDDLQWIDGDGRLVLDELVRLPDPPPALLVVTRATAPGGKPAERLPGEDTLALGALSHDEARALVRVCAQHAEIELDDALERTLADASHGHPIFLRELVHHAGRREPACTSQVLLDDVLWEHVAALAPDARTLLELACVVGAPVPLGVVAAATEIDVSAAVGWVAQLRAERLLSTRLAAADVILLPAHDSMRRSVLGHLGPARIVDYHRRIAVALERSAAADAELLATHWGEAGELGRAAPHAARAAFAAARVLAFDRAASLFRTAIAGTPDAAERHRLRVALGEALADSGRGPEGARTYLECAATADSIERALELRHRAAEQFLRSGHIDEGLDALRDVLRAVRVGFPRTPHAALASLIYHRARLALRGLGAVERAESEIPPEQLRRLDVCWSVASGLSLVDMVRGADFQCRSLLLALEAGEPHRLARALAIEASVVSSEGARGRRRAQPLLDAARVQAQRSGQPDALGWLALVQGIISVLECRFEVGLRFTSEAEIIFRDRCQGTSWELTSARAFSIWSLVLLGRLRELAGKIPDLVRDCRDRGDRLGLVSLTSGPIHVLGLARDDVRRMRDECMDGLSRWAQGGFHFQHFCGLFTLVAADLYERRAEPAVEYLEAKWHEIERSLLLRVEFFRVDLWALRGRAALAAAGDDPRSPHVARAERAVAHIAREPLTWASGYALALRAGIARIRGDPALAHTLLERAERAFAAVEMTLHAAACQLQRGMLLGASGTNVFAHGSALLANQGVRCPIRFATTLLPMVARD
jgi:serine/threonine protein kinase